MALSNADKEWFRAEMKLAVEEGVRPTRELADKMEQTLYGENKTNGLNGRVKKLEKVYLWVSGTISLGLILGKEILTVLMKGTGK